MKKMSFAIIGGGPAAFYSSKLLSRLPCNPIIHVLEKELCPFGLLRYGVAPDHISIKKSEMTLSDAASNPAFKLFANVNVTPESLKQVKEMYSGVIFAYGAERNHIPVWMEGIEVGQGEEKVVKYARDIVYWYNGHPSKEKTELALKDIKNVAIIGNGNVAIDIARIFLRNPQDFQESEMTGNALEELKSKNKIETVEIIGRRGVTHSAFSIKEVRELHKLGIQMYAVMEELSESMTESSSIECTALGNHFSSVVRMNKRKVDFIRNNFEIIAEDQVESIKKLRDGKKRLIFRYLLNPSVLDIRSRSLTCNKSYLVGEPFKQKSLPKGHENTKINFDLLVLSTGFEVGELEPDHYDQELKKLRHSDGCVIKGSENKIDLGTYAVGWCKNGPKGVLDETLLTCEQTFNNLRIHLANHVLVEKQAPEPLRSDGKSISFQQYAKLREYELERGRKQKFIKKKLNERQIKDFYGI